MSRIRGSLERHLPATPASAEELKAMARAAWRKHGVALLHPDELTDAWERQTVVNVAERLYGRRRTDAAPAANGAAQDKAAGRGGAA